MAGAPVWGIDIGQCALKALRCTIGDDGSVTADAFDFIEYPQLLSQPEANPYQLVREALQQFLSRNSVKNCKVAISVPGQSGLVKFIKLPPVAANKLSQIVEYESKQQIPFAQNEIIKDWQPMLMGANAEGVLMETEVGLFAMKRDQVYRAIQPLDDVGVELDIIQLTPLAIYNFAVHELLPDLPPADQFDPDNPPPSVAILALGTDTSDLVITNGYQVWQRNVPLGGNHFTKQLTKELKLTFAKAEHLKRNARASDDAKAIFQSMRTVFNDLLTEVQRSLAFFQNVNRKAEIGRLVLLGNAVKLPGLEQYLGKNLGMAVERVESFSQITGPAVLSSPSFTENLYSYPVCYGLCVQALGRSKIKTNLLPREIRTARLVRQKKPWAVAAVAALLMGLALHFFFQQRAWYSVHPERAGAGGVTWKQAENDVDAQKRRSDDAIKTADEKSKTLAQLDYIGTATVGRDDARLQWLEIWKAINDQLSSRQKKEQIGQPPPSPTQVPLEDREELHIDYVESQYVEKLYDNWFKGGTENNWLTDHGLKEKPATPGAGKPVVGGAPPVIAGGPAVAGAPKAAPAAPPAVGGKVGAAPADANKPPNEPGWVIEIHGYHYHNDAKFGDDRARNFVNKLFCQGLETGSVTLPGCGDKPFTFKELGIGFPVVIDNEEVRAVRIPNPDFAGLVNPQGGGAPGFGPGIPGVVPAPGAAAGGAAGGADKAAKGPQVPAEFSVERYEFTIQFCWQEKPLTKRLEERLKAQADPTKLKTAGPAAPSGATASSK